MTFKFVAALLAAIGCSGKPPVNKSYKGVPLATLHGQLTPAPGVTIDGPVRLAVAWFAGVASGGFPTATVTQDVIYQGTFPINYTLDLTQPPPADALSIDPKTGTRGALGVLVVYQDLNNDGALTTIPVGKSPIDRILGSTSFIGDTTDSPSGWSIVYAEKATTDSNNIVVEQGFNLIRFTGDTDTVVPLTTPISIELTARIDLNILVCEEVWAGVSPAGSPICGLIDANSPPGISLTGAIALYFGTDGPRAKAVLSVSNGLEDFSNADISVNGTKIPPSTGDHVQGAYNYLLTSANLFVQSGRNDVVVKLPGQPDLHFLVIVPDAFSITTPTAASNVRTDTDLTVSWTSSTQATDYIVALEPEDSTKEALVSETTTGTTMTFAQPKLSGNVTVSVLAVHDNGQDGNSLSGMLQEAEPIEFVP